MMMRTWEEAIKFDSGLAIGRHCIELENARGERRTVLVEIKPRGKVLMLAKPREGDMYSSWQRVKGDALEHLPKVSVIVWGARDPELMKLFYAPVAHVKKNM
ncbi:hypothetical protein [Burkholderia gladioli]|uniref:hypothetical protein n=1 Tax=Burkholderia gladioli TaxID=28095 RepID=UPI000D0025AA|nr:hypothetical protein [Burkholderia gladioli]